MESRKSWGLTGDNGMATPENYDFGASLASLKQKVSSLDDDQSRLSNKVDQLSRDTNAGFTALGVQIQQMRAPQWQALGVISTVAIAFIGFIGVVIYFPLKSEQTDLRSSETELQRTLSTFMLSIGDKFATRTETAANRKEIEDSERAQMTLQTTLPQNFIPRIQYQRDMVRIEGAISDISKSMVPRSEHTEHWASFDKQHADLINLENRDVVNLQRQIDDLTRKTGITTAETITRLENQLEQLSQRLSETRATVAKQGSN